MYFQLIGYWLYHSLFVLFTALFVNPPGFWGENYPHFTLNP